jgi:hypothetical protein
MSKDYKYKSFKEKDSSDKDKLPKNLRRELEASYRMTSKKIIKDEIKDEEQVEDDSYENELRMSELCCRAEGLSSDAFRCTCASPEDSELVEKHIEYLRQYISIMEIKMYGGNDV